MDIHRRDQDQAAASLPDHGRQGGAARVGDAIDIHGHDPPPCRRGHVHEACAGLDAGIGHHRVHSPPQREGLLDGALAGAGPGDVAMHGHGFRTGGFHRGGYRRGAGAVPVHDHDPPAVGGESQHAGTADTGTGAGDDDRAGRVLAG